MSISHQLKLFLDVVQQGSFAKAATLNDMDNSALSKQIKKLESELGIQLLNRSTRSFSLTSAGEEILEQAKLLTQTLDQVQGIAQAYQSELKGSLRIVSGVFFGQHYIQPVINRFIKQHPQVQITLHLDDQRTDIIADHFDVAFRIGKLSASNLVARKIASTHFALVASHRFIQQHGMPESPQELIKLPAVIYRNNSVTLDNFDMATSDKPQSLVNYRMKGNYYVNDVTTLMSAVQNDVGYALIDLFNLSDSIEQLEITPLLTDYYLSNMDTGIYVVYPNRKYTKLVSEFIHQVQDYIGNPPLWMQNIPGYIGMYR
ncbi:LysR family transcriptional regulator [Vibrio hippocampi]|uniref:HTH-type transcriptional regulator DmlR n=1 Tax=Vibrio hippocampi TaxID=654686 RepID=A0ABN8DLA1_9VIBR|nr:LysR family transcriptional regulator [Vibrio hippocampi]CAH0529548.1 HTH-type transcriptional regulator DmlR [Vibrio hippocampi]